MKKTCTLLALACAIISANAATPTPTDLSAESDGNNVIITWVAPEINGPDATVEGFDTYEPFIVDKAGEWTFYDGDKLETNVQNVKYTPDYSSYDKVHDQEAWAWQVLTDDSSVFKSIPYINARSGQNALCAFMGFGGSNDDWAISPRLSGDAQTISFYAARVESDGESCPILMLYSKTGTATEDFIPVKEEYVSWPDWEEFTFDVPDGAVYFAICYVGKYANDNYGVKIDDVTYMPEGATSLELIGFNVYRDGMLINEAPVEGYDYTDENMANADHIYHVTALYATGESPKAEIIYKSQSGIGYTADNGFAVHCSKNMIKVYGANNVTIYNMSGAMIAQSTGRCTFNLSAGIYIVMTDKGVAKVIVD